MKKVFTLFMIMAMLAIFSPASSQAITLGFDTSTIDITAGDSFSFDLTIAGLTDFNSPALGGWDVDILFDDSQMNFLGYTMGTEVLGLDFSFGDMGGGLIDLAEVSTFFPDLELIQLGDFTLATLMFECSNPGVSSIGIDDSDPFLYLSDEWGDALSFDIGEPVQVNQAPIPEPGTILLLGTGLLGLVFYRRKNK